jgi:tRNA A37 threonylcarbamoyladenosine modification protein TsaB
MQAHKQSNNITFAIDGSFESLSMAFFEGEFIIDSNFIEKAIHSVRIISTFDDLLKKTQLHISDIKTLYVTIGPGRYSSLRVTLSTIKGLFFDFLGSVYCVNTMDLIAANCPSSDCLFVSKKTSKGEITHYYSTIKIVQRLDKTSQNCYNCDCASDIKNLFRIDKKLFVKCNLSNIAPIY